MIKLLFAFFEGVLLGALCTLLVRLIREVMAEHKAKKHGRICPGCGAVTFITVKDFPVRFCPACGSKFEEVEHGKEK